MSNFASINIISMVHYDKELKPTYTSYGYKISDDYASAFCDMWESLDEFRNDLMKYDTDVHKALVKYITGQTGDTEADIIRSAVSHNDDIYIGDDCYEGKEIGKWLEDYNAQLV